MSKKQWVIVFSLAVVGCLILAVNGAALYLYLNSSQTEVAVAPVTPAPTPTATPTPTPRPTIALPSQENTAVPTPLPTQVVTITPESREKNDLIEDLNAYMAEHAPPTKTPTTAAAPAAGNSSITFKANPTSITDGSCSTLSWRVEGVKAYWVDGQPGAGATGSRSVCPDSTQSYELKYQMLAANNLLKTYSQVVTVFVNEPADSPSYGSGGGGSSGNTSIKAGVCEEFRRDLDRAANDRDEVAYIRTKDEMELWQCDGDPNFIPTVCDLLALFRRWAAADRDATWALELEEKMQQEGCQ